ncbi:MAG: DUF4142 domain-containing protein, partial [Luteimonas sp.]
MHIRITLLAAAMALGLSACNNQDPANDTTGQDVETTAVAQGVDSDRGDGAMRTDERTAAGADRLSAADRKALMTVEEIDRHEIAAAEDALRKTLEPDVRSYAETLRDDHTRNLAASRRMLSSGVAGAYAAGAVETPAVRGTTDADPAADTMEGRSETPTTTTAERDAAQPADPGIAAMRAAHDAERARLAALGDDAFATAWVDAMVKGHEDALATLDGALIQSATDEEV